jgi:hypothetical protein
MQSGLGIIRETIEEHKVRSLILLFSNKWFSLYYDWYTNVSVFQLQWNCATGALIFLK